MKTDLLKRILILLTLGALASLSGCAAVAVGGAAVGTVAYMKGDLDADLNADLTRSVAAVDSAIYYLRLLKISQDQTHLIGKKVTATRIIARDPDDYKIVIKLSPVNDNVTHIAIRVGVGGNENRSQAILTEIQRSLVW